MDDPTADPFTRAFTRLWDVLMDDLEWAASVKPGNRPKGDAEGALRDATRRNPVDFDEVYIIPSIGGTFPFGGTNNDKRWTQNFQIQINTGSSGFVERLFPLKFKTLRALNRAKQRLGQTLGLDDLILDVSTTADVSESNIPTDPNKPFTNAWHGVIGISVLMNVSKTTLS